MTEKKSAIIRCIHCLIMNRIPVERLGSRPVCGSCKKVLEFPQEPLWAKAESFDFVVANWAETLLIVFTAPLCLHCKIVNPIVAELAREKAGMLKVLKVDVENDAILPQRFKVTKTPTFVVFKNGTELLRVDGAPKDKGDLVKWVENMISFENY